MPDWLHTRAAPPRGPMRAGGPTPSQVEISPPPSRPCFAPLTFARSQAREKFKVKTLAAIPRDTSERPVRSIPRSCPRLTLRHFLRAASADSVEGLLVDDDPVLDAAHAPLAEHVLYPPIHYRYWAGALSTWARAFGALARAWIGGVRRRRAEEGVGASPGVVGHLAVRAAHLCHQPLCKRRARRA